MLQSIGRDNRILMLALLLWALGEGLWVNLRPIYIEQLGATPSQVGLVLAIDVSVEADLFPGMQAAVKDLLGSLGEDDQIAVIAFADDVRLVQGFAGRDQAANAVDELVAGGSFTVLNEGTVEAATKASESSLPRRAAIVVTDSPSNLGSAQQETIDTLGQIGVPVHLVGYGTKIAANTFKGFMPSPRRRFVSLAVAAFRIHQG